METTELKKSLADRAESFCQKYFPSGKRKSGEWEVGSLHGEPGSSMRIRLTGNKAGVWSDFAAAESGGNLLDLLFKIRNDNDWGGACDEAREFVGIPNIESRISREPRKFQTASKKDIAAAGAKVKGYLQSRGLSLSTIEAFKVAAHKAGDAVCFPHLSPDGERLEMTKFIAIARPNGKKKVWSSAGTQKTLFGKHLAPKAARALVITEGEIDTMTVWQSAQELEDSSIAVASVPFGAKWEGEDGSDPNTEWIEADWDWLQNFEKIFLCLDDDEQGDQAAESIAGRLGRERCFRVKFPQKDANAVWEVMDDPAQVIMGCLREAEDMKPSNLCHPIEYLSEVVEHLSEGDEGPAQGVQLPWSQIGGRWQMRPNELTIVTGTNGSGKSQWLNFLMTFFMRTGKAAMVASLEVKGRQTVSYMVNQLTGAESPPPQAIETVLNWMTGRLMIFDHVGTMHWEELLQAMRYCYRKYGASVFVIDSMMKCGIREDDLDGQKKFIDAMGDFVNEFPIHLFVVIHPRKMQTDTDKTSKADVKGVGALTDAAHNVFRVWRNKEKEEQIARLEAEGVCPRAADENEPDVEIKCQKQRNDLGEEPIMELWFDKYSRQYSDHRQPAVQYIERGAENPVDEPTSAAEDSEQDEAEPLPF